MTSKNPSIPPGAKTQSKQSEAAERRREARAEQIAAGKKKEAASRRNRKIGIASAVTGGVVVIGLVVTAVVMSPQRAVYSAGSAGAQIDGVETFQNSSEHVETPVVYPESPPTGGPHASRWLNCGIYSQPVPNENAVHSMEHGAVWVTYDADKMSDGDLKALKLMIPSSHAILSPMEDLPSPIVLSGWNAQVQVESVSDERIQAFMEEYWMSNSVPEPGALCSGGLEAPGRTA